MKHIHVFETVDALLHATADYIVTLVASKTAAGERFSIVLSGGGSPKKLYALLASEWYRNKIDWSRIDFFFGDERYVPHEDDASNFKMANEVLLKPLGIASSQIFAVNTNLPPAESADHYWHVMKNYFGNDTPVFDLILLGLGDNSHTASLFPHTNILHQSAPTVTEVFLEDQKMYRITFNAPLINAAKQIAFLVYGEDKSIAVKHVLEDDRNIEEYPAQLIEPVVGVLHWFMDRQPASLLNSVQTNQ